MTYAATEAGALRRSQAERSATTQRRLLDAAIECLHRVGYSQTTLGLVADTAGVSRGALTHQYPTKIDLMLAVVRLVYDDDIRLYGRLAEGRTPREVVATIPQAMWEVLSRPSAIAVIEIMLASRSDRALNEQLGAIQAGMQKEAGRRIVGLFDAAGLQDRPDGAAIHRLFVGAVAGLAIEQVAMGRRARVEDSIRVLTEVLHLLYPELRTDRPA